MTIVNPIYYSSAESEEDIASSKPSETSTPRNTTDDEISTPQHTTNGQSSIPQYTIDDESSSPQLTTDSVEPVLTSVDVERVTVLKVRPYVFFIFFSLLLSIPNNFINHT